MTIWYKLDEEKHGKPGWESESVAIKEGLPTVTVFVEGVEGEDGRWFLNSYLITDEDDGVTLECLVESNAALEFGDDLPELLRDARWIAGEWLRNPPAWLVRWLERELAEARVA